VISSQNAARCTAYVPSSHPFKQIIQIIIIPPPTPLPRHHNLLLSLLLLLRHTAQQILQLLFGDFRPELSTAREGDQVVLDGGRAGFFDEADSAQAVGGWGGEELGEDGCAGFGW
jgi:hypothetical protein